MAISRYDFMDFIRMIFNNAESFYKSTGYSHNIKRCEFLVSKDQKSPEQKYYLCDASISLYLPFIKTILASKNVSYEENHDPEEDVTCISFDKRAADQLRGEGNFMMARYMHLNSSYNNEGKTFKLNIATGLRDAKIRDELIETYQSQLDLKYIELSKENKSPSFVHQYPQPLIIFISTNVPDIAQAIRRLHLKYENISKIEEVNQDETTMAIALDTEKLTTIDQLLQEITMHASRITTVLKNAEILQQKLSALIQACSAIEKDMKVLRFLITLYEQRDKLGQVKSLADIEDALNKISDARTSLAAAHNRGFGGIFARSQPDHIFELLTILFNQGGFILEALEAIREAKSLICIPSVREFQVVPAQIPPSPRPQYH